MEQFGHSGHMAGEISLGAFRDAFSTPSYENILWQTSIRILNLHIGKLYPSVRELVYQIDQFPL